MKHARHEQSSRCHAETHVCAQICNDVAQECRPAARGPLRAVVREAKYFQGRALEQKRIAHLLGHVACYLVGAYVAGDPVCLAFDEALKFRAHPEPQVRTAARAVHIFVRGFGSLDDYGSRFSLYALFEGILHEVAAKRYDDGYLIVDVKRRVRVWGRVKYLDEKDPASAVRRLGPGRS